MRTAPQDVRGGNVTVAGRVNSDGSIGAGVGFTVTKSGTGVYNIRFDRGRLVSLTPTPIASTYLIGTSSSYSGGAATVTTFVSSTGASADVAFGFTANLAIER